jgi:hypothetical protein
MPIGLNMYPFNDKRFGFHIEASFLAGEAAVFRTTWGIRFRFREIEENFSSSKE